MNQFLHPHNLVTVYHKVNHGFLFIGISAFGIQIGYTASENLTKLTADFLRLIGNDNGAFCSVYTVYDKIDGFQCSRVSNDGIQGQDPAV